MRVVYEALLFLHVLAAFVLVAAVVIYSAVVLGAPAPPRVVTLANVLWDVGSLGVLVLGVWLVLDLSAYELWDGWIIAAIVLWALAAEIGRRTRDAVTLGDGDASVATVSATAARLHWLRTALTLALLIVMIYKPGA